MVVARVRRTILDRGLIAHGTRVLAACSGGPDSAGMLLALAQLAGELDFELEAASVDHGLRPDAADDVAIAREQALGLGVPFHALRVEVAGGGSLQAAARDARYAALLGRARELGAARIATGHTRDDQAETVLMRLLRGGGLRGISAIQPLRADGVVRPLIDCTRAAVSEFARPRCQRLADDGSNRDPRFERVRVRERLIPVLLAEDSALIEHLAELADDARDATEALGAAAQVLGPSDQSAETIDLSRLHQAPAAVRRAGLTALVQARTGHAPGRAHLADLERALDRPGEVWLPGDWLALGGGDGRLRLRRRQDRAPGHEAG